MEEEIERRQSLSTSSSASLPSPSNTPDTSALEGEQNTETLLEQMVSEREGGKPLQYVLSESLPLPLPPSIRETRAS